MTEMNRDEYLAWAKRRALKYLDEGDLTNAFISMLSDLKKHPQLEKHAGIEIGMISMVALQGWITNPVEVRRWIEGFN
jgi:hypothetical protein